MTQIHKNWLERKAEKLIARARASQFKRDIFADADRFRREGYVPDVALMMSLRYWAANPVTGEVLGVEVTDE